MVSPIAPPRAMPSPVFVRSFAAVSASFRPPSLPVVCHHLTQVLRYSSVPPFAPLLKPSALRLSSLHRQLPQLPLSLSPSFSLKGTLFPSNTHGLLAKALSARGGDHTNVGSHIPLSEEQRQRALNAIASVLLILIGAALWVRIIFISKCHAVSLRVFQPDNTAYACAP